MRRVEKRLRDRIDELEAELKWKSEELEVFRNHFSKRFRWWIELLSKNTSPNLGWMIEDDAKVLHKLKSWWW